MKDKNNRTADTTANDSERDLNEPTHTTKGGITAPKFGSAGSGGAENEPVTDVERDADSSNDAVTPERPDSDR